MTRRRKFDGFRGNAHRVGRHPVVPLISRQCLAFERRRSHAVGALQYPGRWTSRGGDFMAEKLRLDPQAIDEIVAVCDTMLRTL
ncbi:MAG: hypothetical protein LOY04_17825, partial [Rhodococcus ruber]|nr:hypothetical protein [Rhodococcus ruber]